MFRWISAWFAKRRRARILARPMPDSWLATLEHAVPRWNDLSESERAHLCTLVRIFVAEKNWEGCGGLVMNDEIRVTIAGCACLLLLGLEHDYYRNVESIYVYPSTVVTAARHSTLTRQLTIEKPPVPIHGEAMRGGPIVLVWDAIRHDTRHPRSGHNVVFHEFAHKLDMLDGLIDGTPMLAPEQYARWVEVCTREFEQLRHAAARGEPTSLDPYGATNVGEFFAVATEHFFVRPRVMRDQHRELYEVLRGFYAQDPAA
ncbi:MAG: zinc-dependent peptidase [Planctomycetes bacterium]|nr:zinc-dependent peptidase [Planctomycetota bacterium]